MATRMCGKQPLQIRRFACRAARAALLVALLVTIDPHAAVSTQYFDVYISADNRTASSTDVGREVPSSDTAQVSTETITELVHWIADHTDYDVVPTLRDPPQIRFCSTGGIISYEGKDIVVDKELVAAYDRINRVIYLVRPWSASNVEDVSRVLHELIHAVQFENRSWRCSQEPEWETYHLQADWLAEHGVEKEFDWSKIFMLSQCPEDVLPMTRPASPAEPSSE